MRKLLILIVTLGLAATSYAADLGGTCGANFPTATVCDDFNTNVKDPTKWGADIITAGSPAPFRNEGGQLNYLVSNATNILTTIRRPALQLLPYDTDWVVELEVYFSCNCGNSTTFAKFGLYLENSADPTDDIWFNGFGEPGSSEGFEGRFVNNGAPNTPDRVTGFPTIGVLTMSYDHNAKTVTLEVGRQTPVALDVNPIPVNTTNFVATYNVTPWGMANGSTFQISVIADLAIGAQPSTVPEQSELFRITIGSGANQPPVASNDVYSATQDTLLNVAAPGVLTNDVDPDNDVLTAVGVSNPVHATSFTFNPDGSFDYTPTNGFAGIDSFTYHANDGTNDSADATALISVGADTPTGTGVNVQLDASPLGVNPLSITFSNVTVAGSTSVTPIDPATAGSVPNSYSISNNLAFEIATTATVGAPINVCFTLTGVTSNTLATLRVMHNEGGTLFDKTVLPPDFLTGTLCAQVDSLSPFAIAVLEPGPDLTVAITNADFTCTNTTKGTTCTSAGTMTLANNGEDYGSATFTITGTKQEKPGKPPKWKLAGLLDVLSFDLGTNSSSLIQVHLSDDTTLDGSDTPLLKKPISTAVLDAAAVSGKAVKVKLAAPKGVDLSGKHLIIEVDANDPKTGTDAVTETNEDNNTTVIGPIP